jgi:hypothetical protein
MCAKPTATVLSFQEEQGFDPFRFGLDGRL